MGGLTVWDARTWTKQWTIGPIPSQTLTSLAFSPNSGQLATALNDIGAFCEVWDVITKKRTHQFAGHASTISALQFSPDSSLLASASADATIRLWDMGVADSLRKDSVATSVAVSPLGTSFVIRSSNGTVEVWTVESDQLAWTSRISGESSQGMAISPDDKFLALYTTRNAGVCIFDLQSGQLYAVLKSNARNSVHHVSFRSDSRQVVFVNDRREAELWDVGRRIRMWKSDLRSGIRSAHRIAFSPQYDLLVWSGYSKYGLLDAISGESTITWPSYNERTPALAWSADGLRLLTGDSEMGGKVRVWDMSPAQSTEQAHPFEYNTNHRATFCSFFDGHRYILTDHGLFPIPPQHRPTCAANECVPPSLETFFRLRDDGWIWLVGRRIGERRVCWLPPAYRRVELTLNENIAISRDKIMLVTDSRRVVFLNLKKWLENAYPGS